MRYLYVSGFVSGTAGVPHAPFTEGFAMPIVVGKVSEAVLGSETKYIQVTATENCSIGLGNQSADPRLHRIAKGETREYAVWAGMKITVTASEEL